MKSSARAVVIGGGVVGASVLYHLAKIGWTDVVLLEKSELTSGSTWHAAGGMHTFNGDANISRLQKYTIDLYREIEALSGQSCGLHPNGGLMLAATEGEMDCLKLIAQPRPLPRHGDRDDLASSEAQQFNPLIDDEPLHRRAVARGWRPCRSVRHDAGLCEGGAHARRRGRPLHPGDCRSRSARDGTWDVVTDKGTIHAEHVVNCGGLWAREVGRMVGLELPVLAMEHHYIITEDDPGARRAASTEIVNTTDYRRRDLYAPGGRGRAARHLRAARHPLVAGEDAGRFLTCSCCPTTSSASRPYFEVGFKHFPALGRVGIKKAVNGPFTFAPDGNPLVGPVRGLRNFWVACAVMAGFSQGGGIGLVLSRWMAEDDPGQDILAMDVARFGAFATPKYTSHQGAGELSRAASASPIRTRNCRPRGRSAARPIYDRLKAAGAVMGANFGLEHALWFAPPGVEPTETPTYRRSNAFPHRARRMPGGAHRGRHLRDVELRQVRGHRPRRARAGSTACSPAASRSRAAWRSRRC